MFFINVFFNIISMNYEITTYVFNYVQQNNNNNKNCIIRFFFLQYKIKNFSKII